MENLIYKSKAFAALPDDVKDEHKTLRADFVKRSNALLKKYEKAGGNIEQKAVKFLIEDTQAAHDKFIVMYLCE